MDAMDDEFRLPINHQITENLDRDNLEQASMDKQIDCNNVGFQLLLKMGWKGKGLGKQEQGEMKQSTALTSSAHTRKP